MNTFWIFYLMKTIYFLEVSCIFQINHSSIFFTQKIHSGVIVCRVYSRIFSRIESLFNAGSMHLVFFFNFGLLYGWLSCSRVVKLSLRFWTKWNSIWFKIESKTVTRIISHSIWQEIEYEFSQCVTWPRCHIARTTIWPEERITHFCQDYFWGQFLFLLLGNVSWNSYFCIQTPVNIPARNYVHGVFHSWYAGGGFIHYGEAGSENTP